MRFLRHWKTAGIKQTSFYKYQSTSSDPQLYYEVTAPNKGYIVLFLKCFQPNSAPKIYFDNGCGFSEDAAIVLKAQNSAIYHLPLSAFPNICGIRFDPSETPISFSLVVFRTKSTLITGLMYQFLNRSGAAIPTTSARKNLPSKLLKLAKDAPVFFRWIATSESFYSSARQASLPSFIELMDHFAKQAFDRSSHSIGSKTLISIVVPCYNASTEYLADLVSSFSDQHAVFAELIISDDASSREETLVFLSDIAKTSPTIRVIFNPRNEGISAATNAGILAATGQWLTFIDHDDALAPHALHVIREAIEENADTEFFYTDEYIADGNLQIVDIFCKPAFDEVLLSGVNFVNHMSIYNKSRLEKVGLFDAAFDGSQDYELLLRYISQVDINSVVHIPFPAYLWRRAGDTFSVKHIEQATVNARRALSSFYSSKGRTSTVVEALGAGLHKIDFKDQPKPLVSVVVLNKNSYALISRLCDQLLKNDDYKEASIIVVDNGSTERKVLDLYDSLKASHSNFKYSIITEEFNFSKMCNRGAVLSVAPILLFLNNDIEVLGQGWLSEMVQCLSFPSTGIVGAKLIYPNGSIQHNGVIVGLGAAAGHWYVGEAGDSPGPMGRFYVRQSLSAVTGACMLVTRECFEEVGGFDEAVFPIAYNDVDFCLKARNAGYRIVWTPFAELTHHESQSRGLDERPENIKRFERDKAALRERHATERYVDDSFSPLYERWTSVPALRMPSTLPSNRKRGSLRDG